MEKYDVLNVVGEGSYGLVMRCRHKESGQFVAIKKFLETEDDPTVRKMAIREIRMLKKLHHENLVNMLEVFRRKRRFFLVFEYLEHTVLEELEARTGGLGFLISRKYIYQVLRALDFIHAHNVIHRDVKPENVLVSRLGVIKLCDFGFARSYAENETFTDYVATRWYRSPELLVGDPRYGKEVDIWAVGCLYSEMMTGEPLFPGESDIDQLFQIVKVLGKLTARHQLLITHNTMFKGMKQEKATSLLQLFPDWNRGSLDFLNQCLQMDGAQRSDTATLLKHNLFRRDDFLQCFLPELRAKIGQEAQTNPLLKRLGGGFGSGSRGAEERLSRGKTDLVSKLHSNSQKDRVAQIGLSLLTMQNTRGSFGNEDQIAPFRHYLSNSQPKSHSKQISINNLVFSKEGKHKLTRVLSAKPTKQQSEKSLIQAEMPPSPVHFQSLQPETVANLQLSVFDAPSKTLSPVSNLSLNGQYFNQKRSTNVLGIQQSKGNIKNLLSQIPTRANFPKPGRNNLLDVSTLTFSLGTSPDLSKDPSPRLFPSHPWLCGNLKTPAALGPGSKPSSFNKKNFTDWKNVARDTGSYLLPNFLSGGPSASPYKGNKKKLSPMSTLSFPDKISPDNTIFPTPRNFSPSSDQENNT